MEDGTVMVVAAGPRRDLEELELALKVGPEAAEVSDVRRIQCTQTEQDPGVQFEIVS